MDSHREFGDIDFETPLPQAVSSSSSNVDCRSKELQEDIIGSCRLIKTPFGDRPVVYSDWTASGRSLKSIEDFISSEVLPYYGNTHTTTSLSGHQSTCYRHEARQIVAELVNAKITGKASQDLVLFCGNGTTGAVEKLISCLGLDTVVLDHESLELFKPVVFVSKMEHHSNLIPWRESCSIVVEVEYDEINGVSLQDLEAKLKAYSAHRVKIGSFTAASNITGKLLDLDAITILLHRYDALAFFDCASAAPYIKIDMNPVYSDPVMTALAAKDAIFFSGHKFLGGPGSSGVLVVKKMIMPQPVEPPSSGVGGGTVFYVSKNHHRFLSNREEREEGGTPNIVGDIRLGLVLNLTRSIGIDSIQQEEFRISKRVEDILSQDGRIILLGRGSSAGASSSLPIFSFLIRCFDRFLHYHFVCALLNDLFGVQSRGGCMCAGPYAQLLLGITETDNDRFEATLLDKHEVLRPGFTRLSFPYWASNAEIDFVCNCIKFVAEHGWKFLPLYRYNPKTGEWAHRTRLTKFPERRWLSNFAFQKMEPGPSSLTKVLEREWNSLSVDELYQKVLKDAELALKAALASVPKAESMDTIVPSTDDLRWFVTHEDIRFGLGHLRPLRGPIQPNSFVQAGPGDHSTVLILTPYAHGRNEKLSKRDDQSYNIPRFLSIFLNAGELTGLREILRDNLINGLSTSKQSTASSRSVKEKEVAHEEVLKFEKQLPVCELPRKVASSSLNGVGEKVSSGIGSYFPADSSVQGKFAVPPKKLMKLTGQAIKEWGMIQEGDRLLLGLSGGKDSLALLHILKALQRRAPIKFEIACATVDPQTASFDPSPMIPYLQSLGVTYHYLSEPIVELAKSKLQGDSLCAFCSRFKRGLLYSCCRTFGYNKLVLAQHLDDLAESFFMSLLHNGQVRTMKANYGIEAGDVRVIRPLCYVRESMTRDFSQSSRFPIINENCPACFEEPKERARIKTLLSQEEAMVPNFFHNMRRALIPFMSNEVYETMHSIAHLIETEGKSKLTTKGNENPSKRLKPNEDSNVQSVECNEDYCAPCFEIA